MSAEDFLSLPISQQRLMKLMMMRIFRDAHLKDVDFISTILSDEREGIDLGLITDEMRVYNREQRTLFLFWKKEMKDLPQIYSANNYELLDALDYDSITKDNTDLFRPCPLSTSLTIIN